MVGEIGLEPMKSLKTGRLQRPAIAAMRFTQKYHD